MPGRLFFNDVTASDVQNKWQWACQSVIVKFSWWHLLCHRLLKLKVYGSSLMVKSNASSQGIEILDHIKKWIDMPPGALKTNITSIDLSDAFIVVESVKDALSAEYIVNLNIHITPTNVLIDTRCLQAQVTHKDKLIIGDLQGDIHAAIELPSQSYLVKLGLACQLSWFQKHKTLCHISGVIAPHKGSVNITSEEKKMNVSIVQNKATYKVDGALDGDLISKIFDITPALTGEMTFSLNTDDFFKHYYGIIKGNNLIYDRWPLPSFAAAYKGNGGKGERRSYVALSSCEIMVYFRLIVMHCVQNVL